MLNIRCLKKCQTSLRWVSTKLLQILENLHSRQDKCFTPDILPILLTSYSLVLLFHPSLHSRSYLFFFFTYIPPSLGTFLHFYYIHLFFLSIQFLLSSLLPFAPLLLYTSLNPASLSLSLLSHSPTFLSASFTLHQEVHTSDESDCDDDLVPKTGMEVHTHTHTLYVFVESDIKNVIVLVWAENINHSICNKQCRHTAFKKAYHMIWTPRHLNVDFICFSASQPKLHPGR